MGLKTTYSLLIFLVLFSIHKGIAQNPFEVAIFNESTSVPFSGLILKPLNPGIQVGTDIPWNESEHHKTYLSVSLRYIFHKNLYKAIAINLEFGYDYKVEFGMNLKTAVGVGYMHTFNVKEKYSYKNEKYSKAKDLGYSRFTPSFSLGLGYRFDPDKFSSDEIFIKQQYWLELPYSPGFIPLMSHANSMVGAKFH